MRSISTSQTAKGPPRWEGLDKLRDVLFVQVELAADVWVHQVLNGEHLIQGFFIHESLVHDKITNAASGLQGFLRNDSAVVVANEWVEVGVNTNGVDIVLADEIGFCSNAIIASFTLSINSLVH